MKTYSRWDIDGIAATLECSVVGMRGTRVGQTVAICHDGDTESPVRRFVYAGSGVFLDFAEGHMERERAFRELVARGSCSVRDSSSCLGVWARVLEKILD